MSLITHFRIHKSQTVYMIVGEFFYFSEIVHNG